MWFAGGAGLVFATPYIFTSILDLQHDWYYLVYFAATLAFLSAFTGVYHLGYDQFREDGIGAPEFGNTVISIPMLATANPVGSVMAHASMHIAADIHVYETDVYLPPQTEAPD